MPNKTDEYTPEKEFIRVQKVIVQSALNAANGGVPADILFWQVMHDFFQTYFDIIVCSEEQEKMERDELAKIREGVSYYYTRAQKKVSDEAFQRYVDIGKKGLALRAMDEATGKV